MNNQQDQYQDDEVTIRDLILTIKDFSLELLNKKYWIIFIAGFFCIVMAFMTFRKSPQYTASISFMVNDEKGRGSAGINAILGSFGFGGGGGDKNLDKILALSKSRNISQKAFFENQEIGGNEDYLANHIINYKDSIGQWAVKPSYKFWYPTPKLKGFHFSHDSLENFTKLENSGLMTVHKMVIGNRESKGLISSKYNENTGIMTISATSMNPDISYHLVNKLFDALSKYYIDKSIEKQLFTYNVVKSKTDSIQSELRQNEYSLASLKDTNRNIFQNRDNLSKVQLEGKIRMGYAALAKALENLAIADFSLKNNTPFIQVIDKPLQPLTPLKDSFLKVGVLGGFIGAFLSIFYFILRKIIRDSLKSA